METQDSNLNYLKAKNRVDKLKRFYTHLTVYIVINSIITGIKISNNLSSWESFSRELLEFSTLSSWLIWGIIIGIHAFSVFVIQTGWEERKIQELMNKELSNDAKK